MQAGIGYRLYTYRAKLCVCAETGRDSDNFVCPFPAREVKGRDSNPNRKIYLSVKIYNNMQ